MGVIFCWLPNILHDYSLEARQSIKEAGEKMRLTMRREWHGREEHGTGGNPQG